MPGKVCKGEEELRSLLRLRAAVGDNGPMERAAIDTIVEVVCAHGDDARRAQEGGADRVHLVADPASGEMSPTVEAVAATCAATELPVRVSLRLREGFTTDGGEITRLRGLAAAYRDAGAEGFVMGFLDMESQVALDVCAAIAQGMPGGEDYPWTLDRAIDHTFNFDQQWHRIRDLPGLDQVLTAGSARDVTHGLDELIERATADPWAADVMCVGGGLLPEHVPWLQRAGVRAFHLAAQVRPGGSWKAWVDADLVGSWRRLVDHFHR